MSSTWSEWSAPSRATMAGYPVHIIAAWRSTVLPSNGIAVTEWRATCGATGSDVQTPAGYSTRTDRPRRGEWCHTCRDAR